MIQTTRWSPDTCGCTIEYQWDSSIPQDQRTHTVSSVINACPFHQGLDINTHWNKLQDENPRKNKGLGKLRNLFPSQFDSNGSFLGSWFFDSNRTLHVQTAPGLTSAQISSIQSWCDTNLGVGKVIIS